MSFFSSLKRAVKKVGSAHVKMAIAPLRVTRGVVKASARISPTALVVKRLRSAAARAPTTPIQRAPQGMRARPVWGPAVAAGVGKRIGAAAAPAYDPMDEEELPDLPDGGDDDGEEGAELEGADSYYGRHFDGGLSGWTDDLAKIGVDLAKGAASGALTSVARGLSPSVAPRLPPPPPPGMSTTAKLAIGAAVAVPVLYLLTRRRSASTAAA